jgi:hypothetical protein
MSGEELPEGVKRIDENTFEVKSRTQRGVKYIVDLENVTCECKGFQYRRMCNHLKMLEKFKKWD